MTKRISEISLRTVRLDLQSESGLSLGEASGFFCSYKNCVSLITNWHVVSGCNPADGRAIHDSKFSPTKAVASAIYVESNGADDILVTQLKSCNIVIDLYENDEPAWFEHPDYREAVDVVAIPFESHEIGAVALSAFDIDVELNAYTTSKLWIMDQVFIVGFPLSQEKANSLFPIYKAGTVASEPDFFIDVPRYYVDGKTKKGMSGSPVVRGQGLRLEDANKGIGIRGHPITLIGVYSGRDRQEQSEFEAELGIVWPVDLCLVPILDAIAANDAQPTTDV